MSLMMNIEWSKKSDCYISLTNSLFFARCLAENDWNYDKAVAAFKLLSVRMISFFLTVFFSVTQCIDNFFPISSLKATSHHKLSSQCKYNLFCFLFWMLKDKISSIYNNMKNVRFNTVLNWIYYLNNYMTSLNYVVFGVVGLKFILFTFIYNYSVINFSL